MLRTSLIGIENYGRAYKAGIYLLEVNNRNIRIRCQIYLKLTIRTPQRRHWRRFAVFIVNFEHISHLVLVFAGWVEGYIASCKTKHTKNVCGILYETKSISISKIRLSMPTKMVF